MKNYIVIKRDKFNALLAKDPVFDYTNDDIWSALINYLDSDNGLDDIISHMCNDHLPYLQKKQASAV